MNRLTKLNTVPGIKRAYWSQAEKGDLIDRLADYENTGLEPEEIRPTAAWIRTSDRLPEIESEDNNCQYTVTVLAADNQGYRYIGFFKRFKLDYSCEFIGIDLVCFGLGAEIEGFNGSTVSKWMEIPEVQEVSHERD